MDYIADDFHDGENNNREEFEVLVYYYIRHYRQLTIIKRIESIVLVDSSTAEVAFIAAFTGQTSFYGGAEQLTADVLHFDLLMRSDSTGFWKVEYAEWEEGNAVDLLIEKP